MTNPRRPRLAALAVLAGLALASCSVSTSDSSSGGSATTAAPAAPGEPARGVTDDTITIGAAFIDTAEVKKQFGVDLGTIPDGFVAALAAWTNAEGGINGRDIELAERPVIPVGNESSDAACRELVEDEQVFAIVGTFLADTALCATETYATPYFGGFGLNPERQERSKAPFITTASSEADAATTAVQLLIDEGKLDGKKVAVYRESAGTSEAFLEDHVLAVLEEGDIEVVSTGALSDHAGDTVAAGNEIDTILQRFEADGADTVLAVSGLPVLLPAVERTDWDPQLMILNGQIIGRDAVEGFGLTDPAELTGAIGVTEGLTTDEAAEEAAVQDCIDGVNEAGDLDITPDDIFSKDVKPESRDYRNLPLICSIWELMVASLRAAGDDPSSASILAGLDQVDAVALTGNPDAELSAERWGAGGVARIWEYDPEAEAFFPVGS